MNDVIDRAQEREQMDRDFALQAVTDRIAASHAPRTGGLDGICIDCDEPIEPARLAALNHKTSRCVSCAHDYELRQRGYR